MLTLFKFLTVSKISKLFFLSTSHEETIFFQDASKIKLSPELTISLSKSSLESIILSPKTSSSFASILFVFSCFNPPLIITHNFLFWSKFFL